MSKALHHPHGGERPLSHSAPAGTADDYAHLVTTDRASEIVGRPFAWRHAIFLVLVMAGYVTLRMNRGWVPHDEGTLGMSALRVLAGEWPHVGFDEPYSGGVSVLHAAAFRLLTPAILTTRLVVATLFLASVPMLFYITSRIAKPFAAAGVALVAAVWSVPTYMSAMPSWYNTLFAVFGTAALVAHSETGARRWLFVAGCCAGLSILAKITGLYFVAAVLLVMVYREQRMNQARSPARESSAGYRAIAGALLAAFLAVVLLLFRRRLAAAEYFHFVIPTMSLVCYLAVHEWRMASSAPSSRRLATLLRMGLPFLAGLVLPIALFAGPYVSIGMLSELAHGLVRAVGFRFVESPMPAVLAVAFALPVLVVLAPARAATQFSRAASLRLAILLALTLAFAGTSIVFVATVYSARVLTPIFAVGAIACLLTPSATYSDARRDQIFTLACVAVLCSFVQFPFGGLFHFFYSAQFIPLLAFALLYDRNTLWRGAPALIAAYYAAFAVVHLIPAVTRNMTTQSAASALPFVRAGIRVPRVDAELYRDVIAEVLRHAKRNDYVFAEPESPEVNFLSDTRSPTRNVFSDIGDPATRMKRTLGALHDHDVRVAVVNSAAAHYGKLPEELLLALREQYPNWTTIGKFEIRWRD